MIDQTPASMPEMPVLGPEGEACSSCQVALAVDQRYCLQCGTRRGPSRVDFAELLPSQQTTAASSGGSTVTETTTVQHAVPAAIGGGPWTPFAMVASIAILALMLLVGVMIGKDDEPTQVTATAPASPVATAPTGSPADPSTETPAGGAALGSLENTAPEDPAEASKNLPDTIARPGEPPPVDNEEPGGGTKAEVIE